MILGFTQLAFNTKEASQDLDEILDYLPKKLLFER
jgi:hypothetical protein